MTSGPARADGPRFSPTRGWPVGRIAGVRVLVTPSWIASVAVIGALGVPVVRRVVPGTGTAVAVLVATVLGVLLGVSVLAHELGHCVAARFRGIQVVSVRLYLLGGVSELGRGPMAARDEALVAVAGPAVSGLLAGACWLALQPTTAGTVGWLMLLLLALSNLVIAVFNLMPALPLDGGRLVRAGIWGLSGSRRAGTVVAVIGGCLLAAGLVGWGVYMLVNDGAAGLLPAGIAVAMALFVVIGMIGERGEPDIGGTSATWPAGTPISSVAGPVVRLSTEASVLDALTATAGGAVILTQHDGVARGVLDEAAARNLAGRDPRAPAALVARPIPPEAIVFAADEPDDVLDRARVALVDTFVLVDDAGTPIAAIRAADLLAAARRTIGRKKG